VTLISTNIHTTVHAANRKHNQLINTTDATSGTGTSYHSGAPEFTSGF